MYFILKHPVLFSELNNSKNEVFSKSFTNAAEFDIAVSFNKLLHFLQRGRAARGEGVFCRGGGEEFRGFRTPFGPLSLHPQRPGCADPHR